MRIRPLALAVASAIVLSVAQTPAVAAPLPVTPLATQSVDPSMIEVQHRFGGRGRAYVGPRVVRPIGVRPIGVRPVAVRPVGVWRPRRAYVIGPGYRVARPWWRPGTAVVAGAALGVIAAGTAVAWAGQPPAPGYCWFYTDPTYRAGFWDICPP
jgi:hypothetical protein